MAASSPDVSGSDLTRIITIGQNLVLAINNLNETMSGAFSPFVSVPATATSIGTFGQLAVSTTALYVAYQTNHWLKLNGTTTF